MRISDWNSDVCSSDLNTHDTLETTVASYRGEPGFNTRAIGALAVDVKWPLIGSFLGGTQRLTPSVQVVASPHLSNLDLPNREARSVELAARSDERRVGEGWDVRDRVRGRL